MIVVRIELWPYGDESRAREIGRMHITNQGTTKDRARRGNYAVDLMRRGTLRTVQRVGQVLDYPRQAYSVWRLVRLSIESTGV